MILFLGFALALSLGWTAQAQMQTQTPEPAAPAQQDLSVLSADLDEIQSELAQVREDLGPDLERRLAEVISRSDGLSESARAELVRLQAQLAALGVAPGPSDPPEAVEIASERAAAQRGLAALEAQDRIASYLKVRAHQLLETVAVRQRAAVLDVIMLETPPPWHSAAWREAMFQLAQVGAWLRFSAVAWWEWFRLQGGLTALLQAAAAVVSAAVVAFAVTRWLRMRLGRAAAAAGDDAERHHDERLLAALHTLRLAAVPAMAPLALLMLWHAQGWLDGAFGAVLARGLVATVLLAVGITLLHAHATVGSGLLQPAQRRLWPWRATALMLLALVVAVLKEAVLRQPVPPPALIGIMATVCGMLTLMVLAPMLPGSAWRTDDPAQGARRALARAAVALLAILPLVAALLGRGVLSTYVFNRALAAWIAVSAIAQLRHVLRAAVRGMANRLPASGNEGPADPEDADAPGRIAGYWAAMLVDIGLALLTIHLLFLLLEVPQAQIDYWTGLLFGDVQIGNAVISLPNILLALLVLAGGLFAASQLRRWLGKSVLPQSGMEIGLRTSIAAGAGYLGMVVAFLAAVATAGISLSSVAIVAGALSVGMGFGLRTVVENFVAGLLMLIERPIRVGDWVVIGGTEGTVRRISVRATEIETFDSASVIVPNSLFVSSPVTNWTLQNRRARLRISLGVAYGTKPREVQEALLACARANKHVTAFPAPQALFTDFGDSALLFELRCHVRDTDLFAVVRSELVAAIDQAMRERGIEIPFPQQVVHRGRGWQEAAEEEDQDLPPPVAIRPAS